MANVKPPDYPFAPRSNAHLVPGQYFSFQLRSGRYACGRVLARGWPLRASSRTLFMVGLADWSGGAPATADNLAGLGVISQGWAHVIIFQDYGATIDGHRPLEADGIVADSSCDVVHGREVLRNLAHKHFG